MPAVNAKRATIGFVMSPPLKFSISRFSPIPIPIIMAFENDPLMDGMILSVQLNNSMITKTNMTYLSRGLWWTPRYEVIVIDDQSKIFIFFL